MSTFAEVIGADYAYLLFEFPPQQLPQAVAGLKALGAAGFNVTMPYKQAIMEYLDEIDAEARLLNAVNTVRIDENGRLHGSNTDYFGFRQSLKDAGVPVEGRRVTVLGAGAVSGPVWLTLSEERAGHVTWLNRTLDRAEACAAQMNRRSAGIADAALLTRKNLNRQIRESDLIIDVTPVGMATNAVKEHDFDASLIDDTKFFYHVVYAPWETPLLKTAREHGARTMNGARMSVGQAKRAFEIWTGKTVDEATLIQALGRVEADVKG